MTAPLVEVVEPALRLARRLTWTERRRATTWDKDRPAGKEVVSDVDLAVQDALITGLGRAFPASAFFAEESDRHAAVLPPDVFVIDPIDGTEPMLRGEPTFSVSVSRVVDGRQKESVVYLPAWDVTLHALDGRCEVLGRPDLELPAGALLVSPGQRTRLVAAWQRGGPRRPVVEVPTTSVKVVLVALGLARAAAYVPGPGRPGVAVWDYAAAAHVGACLGTRTRDVEDRDLVGCPALTVRGWIAARGEMVDEVRERLFTRPGESQPQ